MAQGKNAEATVEYRVALQHDPRYGEARLKLAEAYEADRDFARASREYIRAADLLPDNENAQYKAAQYLLMSGQFEDAVTRARKVLDKNAGHVNAQLVLGNALAGMKDTDAGIERIEEAIALDPTRPASYTNLAALRIAEGKEREARTALQKAVEMAPTSVEALLSLANFEWGLGRVMDAERLYQRALGLQPNDSRANRGLALLYMASNRAAEAEPLLKSVAATTKTTQSRLALADYYTLTGRTDQAITLLRELERDEATADVARIRFASLAYDQRRTQEAHRIVDEILKRNPKDLSATLAKTRWLITERRLDDALKAAQTAVGIDGRSVPANFLLGIVHEGRNDLEEAAKSYTQVLTLSPNTAAAQTRLARVQLARGQVDDAIRLAREAAGGARGTPDARAALARGLIQAGDLKNAESEVASLKKELPNSPVVLSLEGHLLAAKNDLPGAERAFGQALAGAKNYTDAVAGLAIVLGSQGRVNDARQILETALSAAPNNPALLWAAARVHVTAKDAPRAETMLKKLLQENPDHLAAYGMLAQVFMAQRKTDQARAEFEELAKRQPTSPVGPTMVAMILDIQGRREEAIKQYQKAIEIDPKAGVAANNLAWLYAESGQNLDQAVRLARVASELIPLSPEPADTLGWVYYKQELPALAIPAFEKSIGQDPKNPTFHYHLGLALTKGGEPERARKAFQEALRLKPDFNEARAALSSLKG